ncbi:group 1 truncated hemoglobin [Saccharopolyspora sp. HNM0986]|uniref:group I truncated hemoglobin n=1 Tax=Saccharopolyspora galaxeae TaxID=2781241 RepID=UPI00190AA013|nr:group 1 truncated hemoglobin [Saccharopolyspora sp. HNM0986]MBK0865500.1 group 1 truncated hemoglobin [Saccharopolyspora sp. HNM0986]
MSIYDEIGGAPALEEVVSEFYRKVLADPALTEFFRGVNMSRLQGKQVEFFAAALGGPEPMRQVHQGRGIEQQHFDLVAQHLAASLNEVGVPADTVQRILTTISPLSADIVTAYHS